MTNHALSVALQSEPTELEERIVRLDVLVEALRVHAERLAALTHREAERADHEDLGADQPLVSASQRATAPHVLIVDDDVQMLRVVARMLFDWRVSTAHDARQAIAILTGRTAVDLLITDYLMPSMTGEALAARSRELLPHLPVLIITGHGEAVAAAEPTFWRAERHLNKPFGLEELRTTVAEVMGARRVAV